MTSFDCRLKAIKACSACGNLHTSAFCCSKEKLKNKILVPMPESSQQHIKIERICFDCGNLLHGLNCLECDLTRKILEKAFQKFQNTSKSSNDNSNVVNAPREPFVVKQDPSVNSSQKSPLIDQKCCYKCGGSLDGIFCQQCTCKSCGKDAHIGYNCPPKTPIISNPEPTKQTINEIPQARKSPHETFQCQPMNEDYYHEQNPCYDSNSFGFDQLQTPQFSVNHQPPQPMSMEALQAQEDLMKSIESFLKKFNRISFGKTPKVLLQAWDNILKYIIPPAWNRPLVYYDNDDDEDYTIAITPVLSTEEPVNSLIMEDEHLDTIPATESDEFIKSSVEILVPIPNQLRIFSDSNVDSTSTDEDSFSSNDVEYVEASPPNSEPVSSKVMEIVIPEVGRIEDDILLIKDDTLRETLLNVNRLVAKIEALKDNPVPSSVVVTKSTSTFPNLFLEETNTFDNSLPESETFCFNLEEPSSGSPTTHSELSLPDYKAFYIDNDHFKEKSSGSTTTHVDFSQYDSFIFDLSNDQFPPANRSDFHEEFTDELAQIISQPEYDCFFKDEPELGNFTMDVVGNIFQTREPRVHVLNVLPTLELDFIPSSESIFAYVVWIFLPFLFIPVIPPYLLSCGDEDTIFDPGISKDCPDCEDSQFCHSSRVSHPQLHLGIRYPNLID
ncbi:hypothetical protein Tco_1194190 [Tanacetum coccineum]